MALPPAVEREIRCPHCQHPRTTKAQPNTNMRCPECRGTYRAPAVGSPDGIAVDGPPDPAPEPDPGPDPAEPAPPAGDPPPIVKVKRAKGVKLRPAAPPPVADVGPPDPTPDPVPATPKDPPPDPVPAPAPDPAPPTSPPRRRGGWGNRRRRKV